MVAVIVLTWVLGVAAYAIVYAAHESGSSDIRALRQQDLAEVVADIRSMNPQFKFGAATAAQQIEGGLDQNTWGAWERARDIPKCGTACGSWNFHSADINAVADLGMSLYRFSVDWSRVQPSENEFDGVALYTYASMAAHARARGVEPFVTLSHFTYPLWTQDFNDGGSWMDTDQFVSAFARYAKTVVTALQHTGVRRFVTFNEPILEALHGYIRGTRPPGHTLDWTGFFRAMRGMARAHVAARAAIQQVIPDAAVGIAKNFIDFYPSSKASLIDCTVASCLHRDYNLAFINALTTGRIEFYLGAPGVLPYIIETAPWSNTLDFIGVNHYNSGYVSVMITAPFVDFQFKPPHGSEFAVSDFDWEMRPESLRNILCELHSRYDLPIVVTEFGCADGDEDDVRRGDFITQGLGCVAEAMRKGATVEGLCMWSLMDNAEWESGFGPRFGLLAVDFDAVERLNADAEAAKKVDDTRTLRQCIASAAATRQPRAFARHLKSILLV